MLVPGAVDESARVHVGKAESKIVCRIRRTWGIKYGDAYGGKRRKGDGQDLCDFFLGGRGCIKLYKNCEVLHGRKDGRG